MVYQEVAFIAPQKKLPFYVFFAALLLGGSTPADAARRLELDLAGQAPGEIVRFSVEAGRGLMIVVTNRVPSAHYDVTVTKRRISMAPLKMPVREDDLPGARALQECPALVKAAGKLSEATEEAEVPNLSNTLRTAIAEAPEGKCEAEKQRADLLLARVTVQVGDVDLGPRDELEVQVERQTPTPKRVWTKIFSTGPSGDWLTTYGFNFVPSRDKRYSLQPSNQSGEFRIAREVDRRELDFSPSVYFSWMPWRSRSDIRISPSAGFGFDLSAPIVFAGASILYNWNIGLFLGLVLHQQTRLRGEFREDQTIRQNMSPDNLVEKTYVPNFAAGVTFRFGSNPFPPRPPAEVRPVPIATPSPTRTPTVAVSPRAEDDMQTLTVTPTPTRTPIQAAAHGPSDRPQVGRR